MRAALLLAFACASTRSYDLSGGGVPLEGATDFFIILNDSTEVVDYDYLANPLNYQQYEKGRLKSDSKLDVPVEILRYLKGADGRIRTGDLLITKSGEKPSKP